MSDTRVDHHDTFTPEVKPPHGRIATTVSVLLFIAALTVVGGRAYNLHFAAPEPDRPAWVLMDFRNQIYFPTVAFLNGDNPYDTETYTQAYPVSRQFAPYLPFHLLTHAPLALLPLASAERVYFLLVVALLVGLAAFSLRCARVQIKAGVVLALAGLLLLSRPGHINSLLGQQGVQMTLFCYAALYFGRRRPLLAAVALALTMAKANFGGPIALLMLARGEFRAVVLACVIAGVATAVPILVLADAGSGITGVVTSVLENSSSWGGIFSDPRKQTGPLDIVALLSNVFDRLPSAAEQLAVAIPVLVLGAWVVKRLSLLRPSYERDALSFNIVCVVALTCTYHQAYDGLILTCLGVGLAAGTLNIGQSSDTNSQLLRWLALGLAVVPAINYVASHYAVSVLGLSGAWVRMPSVANGLATTGLLLLCLRSGFALSRRDAPSGA